MRAGIDEGLVRARSVDVLIQDAVWKGRANNITGARAAAEEALRMDPANLEALALLNHSYVAQKMPEAGAQKVKEYAARQPKSATAQHYLGRVLMASGDRAGARAAFLAAKAADPNFADAEKGLVQLDVMAGKYQDAAKRLEALSRTERDAVLQLWMGDMAVLNANPMAAVELFRTAAAASPNDANAANNLAYLLAEHTTQFDEALKQAQRAVELAPEDPAYSDTLGWVLYRKGLYAPAIQHLERATAKGGSVVWTYHLAMAYAKAGDVTRGRSTLRNALKVNPNVREATLAREVIGNVQYLKEP
jgi:tetratricopeptide (TPR) repeat protein